jgi:hypothetical protein
VVLTDFCGWCSFLVSGLILPNILSSSKTQFQCCLLQAESVTPSSGHNYIKALVTPYWDYRFPSLPPLRIKIVEDWDSVFMYFQNLVQGMFCT